MFWKNKVVSQPEEENLLIKPRQVKLDFNLFEKIGDEDLIWLKFNTRHKIMHLLPFHRKNTLCGIVCDSDEVEKVFPEGVVIKCQHCLRELMKFKQKNNERIINMTVSYP